MTSPVVQRRHSPTGGTAALSFPSAAVRSYPKHALAIAILITAIVGVRVHENFPFLYPLRLVIVVGYGGLALLLAESSGAMLRDATRDRTMRLIGAYFGWAILTAPFALWASYAISV